MQEALKRFAKHDNPIGEVKSTIFVIPCWMQNKQAEHNFVARFGAI